MLYGRGLRSAGLLFVASLGITLRGAAEDDSVRVRCGVLTPDDAAQVEARLRATLLTVNSGTTSVRIDCDANIASVSLATGERTQSVDVVLPLDNPREPLLAAIERLLVMLEEEARGTAAASTAPSSAASSPPPVTVSPTNPVALPVAVTSVPRAERTASSPRSAPRWALGAGALGELWGGSFAYGARVLAERRQSAWSLGAAFGWLTTPEMADVFRTNEFHGLLGGALEEARTGLRGSLGVGASALTIRTQPGVVALTPTALWLVFFDAEVARPVRFGRAWLRPALELRLFSARREVTVDAERRLALPPVCPALFLGAGYEI
jgi:hypothetical protein